jgi:hypothetical protein
VDGQLQAVIDQNRGTMERLLSISVTMIEVLRE